MSAKAEMKIVAARVSVDLWRKVQHYAVDRGLTMQEIINAALTTYIRKSRREHKGSGRRKEK
jgi:hypothetical protein